MIRRHVSSTWVWAERLRSNKAGVTESRCIKRTIIFFVAAAYGRLATTATCLHQSAIISNICICPLTSHLHLLTSIVSTIHKLTTLTTSLTQPQQFLRILKSYFSTNKVFELLAVLG